MNILGLQEMTVNSEPTDAPEAASSVMTLGCLG